MCYLINIVFMFFPKALFSVRLFVIFVFLKKYLFILVALGLSWGMWDLCRTMQLCRCSARTL